MIRPCLKALSWLGAVLVRSRVGDINQPPRTPTPPTHPTHPTHPNVKIKIVVGVVMVVVVVVMVMVVVVVGRNSPRGEVCEEAKERTGEEKVCGLKRKKLVRVVRVLRVVRVGGFVVRTAPSSRQ